MEIRPKYNALDVWEYLEHGLVLEQTFKRKRSVPYFETPSRELVDLTKLCPEDLQPQSADKSLLESLEGTLKLLQGQGSGTEPPSDISIELEDKPSDQSSTAVPAYPCLTDLMPELVRRCKEVIQSAKPSSASVTTLPQALVGPNVADDVRRSFSQKLISPVILVYRRTRSEGCAIAEEAYRCVETVVPINLTASGVLFRESHGDQLQAACVDLSADGQIVAVDCVDFFDASEITFVLSCHLDAGGELLLVSSVELTLNKIVPCLLPPSTKILISKISRNLDPYDKPGRQCPHSFLRPRFVVDIRLRLTDVDRASTTHNRP